MEVESRGKSSLYTYSKVICVLIAFITQTYAKQHPSPRQGNAIVTKILFSHCQQPIQHIPDTILLTGPKLSYILCLIPNPKTLP